MKEKAFDCVEMKRIGAARVMERIAGMTVEQELAYWRERTAAMLERQKQLREKKVESASSPESGANGR